MSGTEADLSLEGNMVISGLKRIWRDERGQDLVEYALLLAFIALAAIGFLSDIANGFTSIRNSAYSVLGIANTTAST